MKILVVSLLRLGDFIQHCHLIRQACAINPDLEIHILLNEPVAIGAKLFPELKKVFLFPRTSLQQMIGSAQQNIAAPVHEILRLVDQLNFENYDQIWNFTHTRLSAGICELVDAPIKKGLVAKGSQFEPFVNEWMRIFNSEFPQRTQSYFHYIEYLAGIMGIPVSIPGVHNSDSDLILIQPLTSDEKKDWGLHQFRMLIDQLYARFPKFRIQVLGAEFERSRLEGFFHDSELAVVSLIEAQKLLSHARLLITGDTSMLHLASHERTPSICLALGSSDPYRTSAFLAGSIVLQPQVKCGPCHHASRCSERTHLCSEKLHAHDLTAFVEAFLNNDEYGMEAIFSGKPIKIIQTQDRNGLLDMRSKFDSKSENYFIQKLNIYNQITGGKSGLISGPCLEAT